jgi:ABC-type polysaccharide/polyol phosphate export permease
MDSAIYMLRTGRQGFAADLQLAARDLTGSIPKLGLALTLAWQDVLSRYRGSVLGPFWITLSMALMVAGIGLLYARLFGVAITDFMPFVALGIVFFGLINGTINEGCSTFIQASGILSQTALPMFTFVWRTVLRNLINLAHHAVIIVAVLVIYGYWRRADVPAAAAGLVLLVVNIGWMALLAGIASARFRDIPQIVTSIMQFAMFLTPVFWTPDRFPGRHAVLAFNPFYHLLQAVRAPLLGQPVDPLTYAVLIGMALAGWALAFGLFARTRRRIVHYL